MSNENSATLAPLVAAAGAEDAAIPSSNFCRNAEIWRALGSAVCKRVKLSPPSFHKDWLRQNWVSSTRSSTLICRCWCAGGGPGGGGASCGAVASTDGVLSH